MLSHPGRSGHERERVLCRCGKLRASAAMEGAREKKSRSGDGRTYHTRPTKSGPSPGQADCPIRQKSQLCFSLSLLLDSCPKNDGECIASVTEYPFACPNIS